MTNYCEVRIFGKENIEVNVLFGSIIDALKTISSVDEYFKVEYAISFDHIICLRQTNENESNWRKRIRAILEKIIGLNNDRIWIVVKFYNSEDYIIL